MAKILENNTGRRNIKLNVDDVISIVREYQNVTKGSKSYEQIRSKLSKREFYLPEEL